MPGETLAAAAAAAAASTAIYMMLYCSSCIPSVKACRAAGVLVPRYRLSLQALGNSNTQSALQSEYAVWQPRVRGFHRVAAG